MLTTYLKRQQTLERYRSGPVGPHLDGFTGWLESRGYQPRCIRRLLRGVHDFSCWAQETGVHLGGLNAEALESFEQHLQRQQRLRHPSGKQSSLFVGAYHFVTFLESIHRVVPLASTQPASALPPLLRSGCEFYQLA